MRYSCDEGASRGALLFAEPGEAELRDRPELRVSHGSVLKASTLQAMKHHREVVKESLPEMTMDWDGGLHCSRLQGPGRKVRDAQWSGPHHWGRDGGRATGSAVFLGDMREVRWTPDSKETMTFQMTRFPR